MSSQTPELKKRSASGTTAQKVIYTGVFTAIYFVVFFVIGMLGFFGPQFMFVSGPLAVLVEGTVIILMFNKVHSFGPLTVLGIIVGVLMMLTGHAWTTLLFTFVCALLADLLARSGGYRDSKKNIFSYAILEMWYIGAWLPIFYAAEAYFADVEQQMGSAYADQMRALFTPTILLVFLVVMFIVALIGGWIGTKIVDKNFVKAGIA